MRPTRPYRRCSPQPVLASGAIASAFRLSAAPEAPVRAGCRTASPRLPHEVLRVYVHADTAANARTAAERSGLRIVEVFDKVGIAVAQGTPAQVLAARTQPSVSYVEGDRPAELLLDTSNQATRGAEAVATVDGPDGSDLDGSGVSIAIIDSGIDGTHPFFRGRTARAPSCATSRAAASSCSSPATTPASSTCRATTATPRRSAATARTSPASPPASPPR
jgi:serine protease AprX